MSPTIVDLTASSPRVPDVTRVSEELRVQTILKSAIRDAQPKRLRVTLQRICNASPEAFQVAQSLLLVPEKQVKHKTIDRRNRIEDDTDQDEDEDEEDSSEPSDEEDDSGDSDDENGDDGSDEEEEEDRRRGFSNGVTSIPTNGVKRLRAKISQGAESQTMGRISGQTTMKIAMAE
ncbi:MAG: hypothetical protein Q9161_000386 [Pseudevernia consocians]